MFEIDPRYLEGQPVLDRLSSVLRKGTVPHAFLFTGTDGTGKTTAATMFAMAANCRRLTAGTGDTFGNRLLFAARCTCRSCNRIREELHPDIHRITPSGTFIRIDRIRELGHALSMKPYEARVRVVIIEQSQAMNPEAANALLKMLEEPPVRTVLILTAAEPSELLPTIRSRCQTIRFSPLSRPVLAALLAERHDIPAEEAAILAALSGGLSGPDEKETPRERLRRLRWLVRVMTEIIDPARPAPGTAFLMAFSERLARERDHLTTSLNLIKIWLRDLIVVRHAPDRILLSVWRDQLRQLAGTVSIERLLSNIDAIEAAQKGLRSNANVRLTLDVLSLRLTTE